MEIWISRTKDTEAGIRMRMMIYAPVLRDLAPLVLQGEKHTARSETASGQLLLGTQYPEARSERMPREAEIRHLAFLVAQT